MEKELEIEAGTGAEPGITNCTDLDEAIKQHERLGFRLDMIFPADSPREALLSKGPETVRLRAYRSPQAAGLRPADAEVREALAGAEWVMGRAGMEYRDLIPNRLGGKTIASHIRLADGGPVADYVHYHKADFQMIYCLNGRIRVVYEDQGPPFWLETGDCVVQPARDSSSGFGMHRRSRGAGSYDAGGT